MTGQQVVVIGSGSAALAAALSASVHGAAVTVLEAAGRLGGTTAMSGGVVWMPGTPWAQRAGVADTPDRGLEYVLAMDLGDHDPELAAAYVRSGVGVLEAVERHSGLRWQLMPCPDYHAELPGGHAVGRGLEILPVQARRSAIDLIRRDPYRTRPSTLNEASAGDPDEHELSRREREGILTRGRGLVAGLLEAALDRGVDVRTGCRARRLETAEGAVVGVQGGGRRFAGRVVVASGGFERNPELVRAFLRGPLVAPAGPPSNRGDGIVMGMSVGARLGNMSEAWWAPAMAVEGETLDGAPFYRILFTDCAQPGGIVVDAQGERFVNEAANYNDLGRSFHRFDASRFAFTSTTSWLIFDAARRAGRAFVGDTVWTLDPEASPASPAPIAEADEPAWMIRRDTVAELAIAVGISPERLEATIDRFNEHAADDADPQFGRGSFIYDRFSGGGARLRPLSAPPFYAIRVLPGTLGTKGGLKTDANGQVLRADGEGLIAGLYAAGNAAANPFGCGYPGPGATIGPAVVFGWLAGAAAATN